MSILASLPVGEGSDDQSGSVAKVLVGVLELSITDVGVAVSRLIIPSTQGIM